MKLSILYVSLFLVGLFAKAQKIIEKNMDYNGQTIDLEVKFASRIEVKTWDKPKVYFKADIQTDQGKYLDLYKLNINQQNGYITIDSEAEPVFKAFHKENNEQNGKRYYYTDDMYEFNYVLYVPKNAQFKVSSINGTLSSEIIEGDFEADLINGDIEIKEYSGNLILNTINGEIDLRVGNASFTAETIHGDIYADENLKLTSYNRHVGQKVESVSNNNANQLKLNTINGNMYLRF